MARSSSTWSELECHPVNMAADGAEAVEVVSFTPPMPTTTFRCSCGVEQSDEFLCVRPLHSRSTSVSVVSLCGWELSMSMEVAVVR